MASPHEIVIEGHDGSAKTPVARRVADALRDRGFRVGIRAPFLATNEMLAAEQASSQGIPIDALSREELLACDIYHLWQTPDGTLRAMALLSSVIERFRTAARNEGLDLILWDRHWVTVLAQIRSDAALLQHWGDFPATFFLEAPVTKTMDCNRFSYDVPWTRDDATLARFYQTFLDVVHDYPQHILARYRVETRTQDLAPIVEDVVRLTLETVLVA